VAFLFYQLAVYLRTTHVGQLEKQHDQGDGATDQMKCEHWKRLEEEHFWLRIDTTYY